LATFAYFIWQLLSLHLLEDLRSLEGRKVIFFDFIDISAEETYRHRQFEGLLTVSKITGVFI
jgi:hypothetical protein